jgi:hypothetical protein
MGSRDDHFLSDERADALMRRLLARADEPAHLPPPPDLVTRIARRLPAAPPALAARQVARHRAVRLMLSAAICGAVGLVALVSLAAIASGNPGLALLFGDGSGGLSRALLTLYLLSKPIVRAIGALGAPLLLAGAVGLVAGGWLWRRLLLPDPAYAYAENRQ